MRILIEWLKEFIKFELSTQKLAEELSLFGLEIDEYKGNVLDFKPTANRADCLSILGVARETAAMIKRKIRPREYFVHGKKKPQLNLTFMDKTICPRYTYRIIENIQVKQSPAWIQSRLKACRIRPINNIVDATNYTMLELGQPLHAFDYDRIQGYKMNIRFAQKGEKITTLDGVLRALTPEMIIIEDKNRIIDLAGIMGGVNSEILKKTKRIVLQAAIFDPIYINKASKILHHQTEASYRYEHGIDPQLPPKAINRASELILELSPGAIFSEIVDVQNIPYKPLKVDLPIEQVHRLLGVKLSPDRIIKYLELLGFSLISAHQSTLTFEVPSWRLDIKIKEDLIEEVGRMYGNNRLPETYLPQKKVDNNRTLYYQKEVAKDILVNLSLTEVINYSFVSAKDLSLFNINPKTCLKIANPILPEGKYMRPNLSINLLKTISKNSSFDPIELFEIGNVFDGGGERARLGIIVAHSRRFRSASEILKLFFDSLQIKKSQYNELILKIDYLQENLSKYKIRKSRVEVIEIDLNRLIKLARLPRSNFKIFNKKSVYRDVSRFPSASRDLAIIVEDKADPDEIASEIRRVDNLVNSVVLFDEYHSEKFGKNKKSLAYHIFYSSPYHSLSNEEINILHQKIVRTVKSKFGARLRGVD